MAISIAVGMQNSGAMQISMLLYAISKRIEDSRCFCLFHIIYNSFHDSRVFQPDVPLGLIRLGTGFILPHCPF